MTQQKSAIITKLLNERISISTPYDRQVIEICRQVDRRFWDSKTKLWYMPVSALESIKQQLESINFVVTVTDYRPQVKITEMENEAIIVADYDAEIYDLLRFTSFAVWMKDKKHWSIRLTELENFLEKLTNLNVYYTLDKICHLFPLSFQIFLNFC